jgi:hypothetical protein
VSRKVKQSGLAEGVIAKQTKLNSVPCQDAFDMLDSLPAFSENVDELNFESVEKPVELKEGAKLPVNSDQTIQGVFDQR